MLIDVGHVKDLQVNDTKRVLQQVRVARHTRAIRINHYVVKELQIRGIE